MAGAVGDGNGMFRICVVDEIGVNGIPPAPEKLLRDPGKVDFRFPRMRPLHNFRRPAKIFSLHSEGI
jgi:hypothetical protein